VLAAPSLRDLQREIHQGRKGTFRAFSTGAVIPASCSPAARTVLVIDDEPGVRESLRVILDRDYRILTAEGGEAAFEILRTEEIAAVTLDLRMPGWGGIETLLRMREVSPHVGVIIVTAHGSETEAMRALRLDACDLLTKPFEASQVLEAVRRAVERSEERLRSRPPTAPRTKEHIPPTMQRLCANKEAESRRQKPSILDGELGLLWAIFDDGIQTYCREVVQGTISTLEYREVERWVFRSGDDAVTSFGSLCDLFGIDPKRMRGLLLKLRDRPDPDTANRLIQALSSSAL
jgi:DNA-binding response OmpR family regulator